MTALGRIAGAIAVVGALVLAADLQPAWADQRNDFLAGTTKDCPGCDLAGINRKRGDLSGANQRIEALLAAQQEEFAKWRK